MFTFWFESGMYLWNELWNWPSSCNLSSHHKTIPELANLDSFWMKLRREMERRSYITLWC